MLVSLWNPGLILTITTGMALSLCFAMPVNETVGWKSVLRGPCFLWLRPLIPLCSRAAF
jgi:hypothetical protein